MQEYKELYASKAVKLYGAYEDYGAFVFRAEMDGQLISGLNFGYSGAALFYLLPKEQEECCKKLSKMYDSLMGECTIHDCEFGNELRLYFVERRLKIQGKFDEGEQFLKFNVEVDQTVIPNIISLLKNKR